MTLSFNQSIIWVWSWRSLLLVMLICMCQKHVANWQTTISQRRVSHGHSESCCSKKFKLLSKWTLWVFLLVLVHEKINLTLCAETVQPDNSQFPEVQNILTERQVRRFNDDLKTCELIVDHIETCSFGIEISLSTKYEVPYSDLVLASGPIPEILGTILREIFQTDKVSSIQLLRLCVIMFVPLDYDKEDKGKLFMIRLSILAFWWWKK